MSLFEELKRRNVFRVAITYIILAWLMAQVAELLLETFGAPDWVLKSMLALFLVGFPFALFFAWAFELTPDGLKKEKDVDRSQSITSQTGHKLDRTIIAVLVVALGYFVWDRFASDPVEDAVQTASSGQNVAENSDESTLPSDKSIAVLPFDNRSSQAEDEYFTTGIHDDLLTQLAQISSLRVISRTSMAQFKDTSKSIREIAELLGVATILEGGVQRAGNQVRINIQLIDAATDAHLWAQTYDRKLTANNIFAIQSEIATAVTLALRATLSPEEKTRIAGVPTQNMEALEQYFRGRADLDQRTLPSIESARMRFERARQLDAGFALALAGEALAIILLSDSWNSYGDIPEIETNAMARPLLETALQLAPDDPQVLAIFGLLEFAEDDVATAIVLYERSLALNPSSGEVLNWNSIALERAGRVKESQQVKMHMIEVDPMSMISLANGIRGMVNSPFEDEQQIEALLQRLNRLDPGFGLFTRATVERNRGNLAAAVGYFYQVLEMDPGRSASRSDLAFLLAIHGFGEEAIKVAPDWAYNVPFFDAQWQESTDIYRDRYQHDPSVSNTASLMSALAYTGDSEAAFTLARELWLKTGSNLSQIRFDAMTMVRVAMKTEHLAEARLYRDAAARLVQSLIEAEITSNFRYTIESQLAALDGRQDDAVMGITTALNKGGMRWHYALQTPSFESLQGNPDFQAQVARHRDLIDADRKEIVAMLCGPDSILTTWEPAPETCQ